MYSYLLKKIIVPVGDMLFGGGYLKTLKKWNEYDKLSESKLIDIQSKELEKILKYTIDKVPFYKGINYNNSLSAAENLKHFPILAKDILRKHSEDLVSTDFNKEDLKKNFSSGSSGVQSYSYSEKKNVFYLQGISTHWYMWGGFKIGDPVMQFGMSIKRTLPKKLKDIFYKVQYENAFAPSGSDYEKMYKRMLSNKIKHIIGYPSAINVYAEYLISKNYNYKIDSIISLGDKLFSHFEDNFKQAFKDPLVIDTYGCAEGFLMACRYDTPYYYISAPHVYIEIVDDNGNDVPDGELGHVLVTCFSNRAQPFIRYKVGDLAVKLPKEKYPKDRKFQYPMLERIVGRETDVVKTPTGKTLIVHSFTGIIEYYPDIKQYQIIQESINEIVIKYITDDVIPLEENTLGSIEEKINKLTDNSVKIIFEKTDFIANSPSGKPQIIKSLL